MPCSVRKGTGVMSLPHVPGARGGWLDQTFTFSGMECGACNGTGVRPDSGSDRGENTISGGTRAPYVPDDAAAGPEPEPPGAEEQLRTARSDLTRALRYSDHLPPDVTTPWIDDLPRLDVYRPEDGRSVLADLRQEFEWARGRYKPVRDIFSIDVSRETGFEREMARIERHLRFLEALMEYAENLLREHPGFRR